MVEVLIPSPIHSFPMYSNELLSNYSMESSDGGYSSPDEAERPPLSPETSEEILAVASPAGVEAVDESLKERVRKQVEWYFSDENLQKDSFLMKHVTRNKQGYVSLKLVASLRKVKTLTKDWKVVLASLEPSTQLQINEEGTKIRRIAAAPKIDYSRIPKTILITNYHDSNPEESNVHKEFGRYGKINQVLILKPGKAIPLDIKSCRGKYPSIGKELTILVEYNTVKEAKMAVHELSQDWRQTMNVQILSTEVSESLRKEDLKNNSKAVAESSKRQQKLAAPVSGKTTSSSLPSRKPNRSNRITSGYDSGYNASRSPSLSPMPSPAPSRKFFSAETAGPSRLQLVRSSVLSVGVVRQPFGPDGTRGFH